MTTKESMADFETHLSKALSMDEEEFQVQIYSKECDNLFEVCAKEVLYSQLFWRTAVSSSASQFTVRYAFK